MIIDGVEIPPVNVITYINEGKNLSIVPFPSSSNSNRYEVSYCKKMIS
jgi:hypothetical protein